MSSSCSCSHSGSGFHLRCDGTCGRGSNIDTHRFTRPGASGDNPETGTDSEDGELSFSVKERRTIICGSSGDADAGQACAVVCLITL